jgi:uncharacterized protein (TIGR03083 family)
MGTSEPVVEALAEEWEAIGVLGGELPEDVWDRATECPGWTVRDVLAHMVGTERSLLGDPPPSPVAAVPAHVQNEMGASNEAWVNSMRALPGTEVLGMFRTVTARRLDELRSADAARFVEVSPSPVGVVPYREFMHVRVMDCWVHEQDMRVATEHPGHEDGPAARIAIDRLASGLPFVVGKKAGTPDGASVRFDVQGALGRRIDIAVAQGRARAVDGTAQDPTTTLEMDVRALWRLTGGRLTGADARERGLVHIIGDAALGERVLESMAFMI